MYKTNTVRGTRPLTTAYGLNTVSFTGWWYSRAGTSRDRLVRWWWML